MSGRSKSENLRSALTRKASGILRSGVPPVSSLELSPLTNMEAAHPRNTLSYRCDCGYLKRDIMCLGDMVDKDQKLFNFCGGLFVLVDNKAECTRCRKTSYTITYCCAFCGKLTEIVAVFVSRNYQSPVEHVLETLEEVRE